MPDDVPIFADSQTYRRGAIAALVGLVVQLVVGVGVAVLGVWAGSLALHAAAWHLLGGLAIWVVLWVVYQQHKLERLEALEAEQLAASDADAARLFDEAGQQLAIARGRLGKLYRYGLNSVTAFVAVYLLWAGLALLLDARGLIVASDDAGGTGDWSLLQAASLRGDVSIGLLLAATVFYALIIFLAARSLAGMTKVPAWQLLRGGAAYLMGNLVVALGLAVAAALELAGITGGFAVMALVTPVIMLLLGVEMVLSLVLGLYRPRRGNEVPRAAFDSRLLGFLTRPESLGRIVTETLRYQFGIDFSTSWVYRLLGRALLPLVGFAAVLLVGLSSLVFVGPGEQAVITTWGGSPRYVGPGAQVKWPWPAGRAERFEVDRVHQTLVGVGDQGLALNEPVLWSSEVDAPTQQFFVTAAAGGAGGSGGSGSQEAGAMTQAAGEGGGDEGAALGELVVAVAAVRWKIDTREVVGDAVGDAVGGAGGLERYLRSARRPEALIELVATEELSRLAATHDIDRLLSINRQDAGRRLTQRVNARLGPEGYDLGVVVLDVGLLTLQPPRGMKWRPASRARPQRCRSATPLCNALGVRKHGRWRRWPARVGRRWRLMRGLRSLADCVAAGRTRRRLNRSGKGCRLSSPGQAGRHQG